MTALGKDFHRVRTDVESRIEQAIARGVPTSQIIRRVACTYEDVQAVRDHMTVLIAL